LGLISGHSVLSGRFPEGVGLVFQFSIELLFIVLKNVLAPGPMGLKEDESRYGQIAKATIAAQSITRRAVFEACAGI
jgi:hypothetical protein